MLMGWKTNRIAVVSWQTRKMVAWEAWNHFAIIFIHLVQPAEMSAVGWQDWMEAQILCRPVGSFLRERLSRCENSEDLGSPNTISGMNQTRSYSTVILSFEFQLRTGAVGWLCLVWPSAELDGCGSDRSRIIAEGTLHWDIWPAYCVW